MNKYLEEIIKSNWSVPSPVESGAKKLSKKPSQCGNILLSCSTPFEMVVPVEWYEISASETMDYLMNNVYPMTEDKARRWINNLKYSHPSYYISQRVEREQAKDDFTRHLYSVFSRIGKKIEDIKFALVGANNCVELESLPIGWKEENILAIDVADIPLQDAKIQYPNITCCCAFVEEFNSSSTDFEGEKMNQHMYKYDCCLALRVLQSSRLSRGAALARIKDILRPGGWLIASIPLKTSSIVKSIGKGNTRRGVMKRGHFDEQWSYDMANLLAKELREYSKIGFTDVSIHYGNGSSSECYVLAKSTN